MNYVKAFVSSAMAAAVLAATAVPSIEQVAVVATNTPGSVVVDYVLADDPAIVTFEVRTNGVPLSIGYPSAVGAVNRFLQPGSHRFTWAGDVDWPGHAISEPSVEIVVKAAATNNPPDYMLISTESSAIPRRYYDKVEDIPGGITSHCYKTSWLPMRRIHAAGRPFRQGVRAEDMQDSSYKAVNASRFVALSEDYYIGVYELTIGQYRRMVPSTSGGTAWYNFCNAVYGSNPTMYNELMGYDAYNEERAIGGPTPKWYYLGADTLYIWPESKGDCASGRTMHAIRQFTHIPKMYFPTSAQWEYACRAGSLAEFANGQTNITGLGWTKGNSADDPDWVSGTPHAVGQLAPNAWGLYDMHGNVREWCCDIYQSPRTVDAGGAALVDPCGPALADTTYTTVDLQMVVHGGGYNDNEIYCTSSNVLGQRWDNTGAYLGVRLCCPATVDR